MEHNLISNVIITNEKLTELESIIDNATDQVISGAITFHDKN